MDKKEIKALLEIILMSDSYVRTDRSGFIRLTTRGNKCQHNLFSNFCELLFEKLNNL